MTLAGALFGAFALFVLLNALNGARGFAACTATGPFGWTLPLLGSLVIGLTAWLLLAEDPKTDEPSADSSLPCPFCGHAVRKEWRLCPFCGNRLDSSRGMRTEAGTS